MKKFFLVFFFFNSRTPEILSLVTLVTNDYFYHSFHFYQLWSYPDENLKNENWC